MKNNTEIMSGFSFKTVSDDFEVEFDIITPVAEVSESDRRLQIIKKERTTVESKLTENSKKIDELNHEIDRLTNHADGIDYMVAVGSGIIAGVVDSLWVGEFSFERGKKWGSEKVENFVKNVANKKGYKGDDLKGATRYLEKYGAPSDSVTAAFGGGLQHHLRDFAHHPTPIGLTFSMLTQFTGNAYGTDTKGSYQKVKIENTTFIGKDIPQKFLFGTVFWFFHMVSDMAGSSSTMGAGTGLPGPILSLLKEISALPFIKSISTKDGVNQFSLWISKLFNGTLLSERDESGKLIKDSANLMRFDLRAELGILYELGRQAIPVILNECIVRGFYFIRRLIMEIRDKGIKSIRDLNRIEWKKCLPWKNRTLIRMLTIATGTFLAFDAIDAAIRGAIKSGGNPAVFAKEFLLRVNFVGVGRFAVAVFSDVKMGVQRSKRRNERIAIYSEQLHLSNSKIFYLQAESWVAAERTEQTISEAYDTMEKSVMFYEKSFIAIDEDLNVIGHNIEQVEENNPGLLDEINTALMWG